MADLLALISRDTQLKHTASTDGGQWSGPCPWCGGRDRFCVWPNAEHPHYWCRQCGRKGDAIQYLRDKDGLSFAEAKERLGMATDQLPRRSAPVQPRQDPELEPPGREWQDAARQIVSECAAALAVERGAGALDYLHARGLEDDTIWRARLGWNPQARELHSLWVERGITMPWQMGADLWAVNVRRFDAAGNPDSDPKYKAIAGGPKAVPYGVASLAGKGIALVLEGEFDALLVQQEAGDLVGAIALGSAKGLPNAGIAYLLPCRRLLVCGDSDERGESMAAKWRALSARVRPVRVPEGKDVTEFWQMGGRVRDWVILELVKLGEA